jgi:GAF domain-containing protein
MQSALSALVTLQQNLAVIDENTNAFHLIHKILLSALDAVESENGSLLLLDEETGELVFVEVIGASRDKLLNYRLARGLGIAGWAVSNRTSRLVEDARRDPHFTSSVDNYTGIDTHSLICVPLMDGDRPLGAIEAVNTRSGRPFNESDKEVMEVVGYLASTAILAAEKGES